jgi:glucose-6-phosphate 1-dehydrogenase
VKDDLLHGQTAVVGLSRRPLEIDAFLREVELCVLEADKVCDPAVLRKFRRHLSLFQLDPTSAGGYQQLRRHLQAIEDRHGMCMNRLFYLAIPPQVYAPVIEQLGEQGLNTGCDHHRAVSRLLVEKPFGYDLTSAVDLIKRTSRYFSEEYVFRIDHYLAKETVQNVLVFRERNPIFAELWSRAHISAIGLMLSEQIGVEGRAEFYDNVGALRDVVQNHLLQLLALVTMELPAAATSRALHASKQRLLRQITPVNPYKHPVVRGQYAGYTDDVRNPGSTTETYVRLTVTCNNRRWRHVPITLATGKSLNAKHTSVTITFVDPAQAECANQLTFRIQPNEGIGISLSVKQPGFTEATTTVQMDFSYAAAFGGAGHPDAYERVLIDAVRGDHSLFATSDEVLESWRILQPVLDIWEQGSDDLVIYQPGSAGPA